MSEKMQIPLPSRESVIALQVQTLLGICHSLAPFCFYPSRPEQGDESPEHDGGVDSSAAVTLMAVCDRLTEIVQDNSRWGMAGQDKLESMLGEMYAANTKLLEASRYATQLHSAPMTQFKPTIGKTPDGKFFAVYGDINKPGCYVLGTGDTLELAIQDFNAQFKLPADKQNSIIPDPAVEAEVVPDKPANFTPKRKAKRKG